MRLPFVIASSPVFLLAGCAALSPARSPQLTKTEAASIVADCTALLSSQFSPAKTVLYFGSSSRELEKQLAEALRARGFAVAPNPTDDAQPVAFNLTAVDPQTTLVRLSVADEWGANRFYSRGPDGFGPHTLFSVRTNAENPPTTFPLPTPPDVAQPTDTAVAVVPPVGPSLPAESEKSPPQAEPAPVAVAAASEPAAEALPAPAAVEAVVAAATPSPKAELPKVPTTPQPDYMLKKPNAENILSLSADLFDRPAKLALNPFAQLYRPPTPQREVKMFVSAAIAGPRPTAIINGKLYQTGSQFEGMSVHAIDDRNVMLLRAPYLLQCPVGEASLTLRLPQ